MSDRAGQGVWLVGGSIRYDLTFWLLLGQAKSNEPFPPAIEGGQCSHVKILYFWKQKERNPKQRLRFLSSFEMTLGLLPRGPGIHFLFNYS